MLSIQEIIFRREVGTQFYCVRFPEACVLRTQWNCVPTFMWYFPSGVWYLFPPLLDRYRGLLRLSECRAVLAWAMPSVSNLVDRQLSPCDGGVRKSCINN